MSAGTASPQLTIDDEFRHLIISPTASERELLTASIRAQGCLEPLYVWKTESGERILLDGHTRLAICTEHQIRYDIRTVKVSSREEAKLWILEHQAGRRNLTDDQRAIVWNEIREQRSKVTRAKQLAAARQATKEVEPVSVKIAETETPKIDTRAAVAKEAKLPENKLRKAQALKKHQPDLYRKVLAGQIKLRDTQVAKKPRPTRFDDEEFYYGVGRTLDGIYSRNQVNESLDAIAKMKKSEFSSVAQTGIRRLIKNLENVRAETEKYIKRLHAVEANA